MRPRSLRLRLTLTVAAFFGAFLACLFWVAARTYALEQSHAADDELLTVLNAFTVEYRASANVKSLTDIVRSPRSPSAAVFDAAGSALFSHGSVTLDNVEGKGISNMGGYPVRFVSRTIDGRTFVVGDNWQDVLDAQQKLNVMLALIWIPLVALAALITWFSVTRTFRPLLAMADEADRLALAGRSSRLAVPSSTEFGPLAVRLNAFLDRLESGIRRQERFVEDAAHELRTPLTILRGQAETALLRSRTPEEYERVLGVIVEEAARLSQLTDTLLVSSGGDDRPVEPQQLAITVQETVDRWRPRFEELGVGLRSRISSAMAAIELREIETVLNNLLANALRHSPQGSECWITLAGDVSGAVLTVSDQGPGIEDEAKTQVFERFFRTDASRNRSEGGFGIGLAICRRMVEDRAGELTVEDNQPHGAKFIVSFGRYSKSPRS
ncbi:MAG: HAMP domain-containing protein [Armatimonadetes bacterium]|nr:HAMP domain-containing protein [Armatimonadota bacterium]